MILRIFAWRCFVLIPLISYVTSQKITNFVDDNEIERRDSSQLHSQKCQLFNHNEQQSSSSILVNRIYPPINIPERNRNFQNYKKDCYSCNWEPWIPIAGPITKKAAVNVESPMNFLKKMPNYYNDLNIMPSLRPPPVWYRSSVKQVQEYLPHINERNPVIVDYMVPPPVNYEISPSIYSSSKNAYHKLLNNPHTNYDFKQKKHFYSSHTEQLKPQNLIALDMNTFNGAVDSYGAPVTGDSLNYFPHPELSPQSNQYKEYLERSIPLPNLSSFPILPFRDYEDFQNNFINNKDNDINNEIKVEKSVKIADYLATIEHPITVIRSPLIDLSVASDNFNKTEEIVVVTEETHSDSNSNTRLSKFPIVVEDVHPAASNNNDTYVNYNEVISGGNNDSELDGSNVNDNLKAFFNNTNLIRELNQKSAKASSNDREDRSYKSGIDLTKPALDYSNWRPTYPVTKPSLNLNVPFSYTTTTKPNILQIIIPYINNKNTNYLESEPSKISDYKSSYTTISSEMTPPRIEYLSVWSDFNELADISKPVTVNKQSDRSTSDKIYDITLQKNIDNWTQQTFSQTKQTSTHKENHREYSPKINEQLYKLNEFKKSKAKPNVISNLIVPTETLQKIVTTTTRPQTSQILLQTSNPTTTVSPEIKQMYYMVTPEAQNYPTSTPATAWSSAPRIKKEQANNSSTFESYRFSIKVEPPQNRSPSKTTESASKIVYSEWPHLVNNLQTTTKKPFTKHPLLGFMDIIEYAINSNSTLKTILGSSLMVTPPSSTLHQTGATNKQFNTVYS